MATLQDFVDTSVPGAATLTSNRHSISGFSKYTVQRGSWKGFEVGAGVTYKSGSVLSNVTSDGKVTPVYGEGCTLLNLMVGYSCKLGRKVRWSINLNVQNILDHDYYAELSRTQVNFGDPRTWSLSNTFKF